jgi:hypothetical protein
VDKLREGERRRNERCNPHDVGEILCSFGDGTASLYIKRGGRWASWRRDTI